MMKIKFKKWLVTGLSIFGAGLLTTAIAVGLVSNQNINKTNIKTRASEFATTTTQNTNPYYSNQQILNALNYGSNPNNYFVPLNFNANSVKYPLTTTQFSFNTEANDISMLTANYFKNATSMVSTGSYQSDIHLLSFANNQFQNYDWNALATKLVQSSNINKAFSNVYKNVGGAIASWANYPQGNWMLGNVNLPRSTWGWSNTELWGLAYSLGSYTQGPFLISNVNQINNEILNAPNNLQNEAWTFQASNGNASNTQCNGVVTNNNTSSSLANQLTNYFTNQTNTSQVNFLSNPASGFGISSAKQNWFNQMNGGSNNPNVSLNIDFANTWAQYWKFNANLFLFNSTYNDLQANTTVAQANNYNNNYANSLANTPISNFYNPATYPTNSQTYFTNPNYTTTPVILGNNQTNTIFNKINVNLAKLLMINTQKSSSFYNLNSNNINNPNQISAWKNPNDVLLSLGWNTKLMHAIYEASELAQKLNDFLNENPIWKTSLNNPTYAEPLTILVNGILDGKVSLAALNGWIQDVKNNPNNFNHFTYVDENGNTLPIVANQTVNFWNELTQNSINLINAKTTSLSENIQTIFDWNTFWNYLIKETFNQDIYVSWSPSYNPNISFKTCVYTPQNGWSPINAAAQMQASTNQNQINLGIKIDNIWFQYPQNLAVGAKNDSLNANGDNSKATIALGQDGLSLENIYQTTQEVNKQYAQLPQITNSLWDAQNSMTNLNAYNEANPIVYLNYENNAINYLVSFQNALQAQNNYLPTNGTNAAIVKQLNFYNLQIIANNPDKNKKSIAKTKTNDTNKTEKPNTITAIEADNATELATVPEKSTIISNWPYYNTDIIGVNMQELLRVKISEALNVPPQLLAQNGLPKDFLKQVSFLFNPLPTQFTEVINQKNANGNYKYANLNNFYNLWNNLDAQVPNRDDYYSDQAYQEALNQFWAKAKTVNNLNYYYCLVISPINLLNYLDPSTYASLINNQFLIPAYQTKNGYYEYFVGISSAFKPLNLNVENNAIVNNVNASGAANNLISLNNNVVINTSKLATENINTTATEIKNLSITLQKQQHDLEMALNGGLNNKANGLNQAYNNTVQKIEAYLDNGNNLSLFKETFDNFALAMQKQLQKIIDNFNKIKKQTQNVWHGIYIGKKLVFDYHNELLEMQNLINNANTNFKTELIKQGKWQDLQNILQTNYLDYVNQLSQTYNSFLSNLEMLKTDTASLKTNLNNPVSVMQGSVITFNLKNWATESGNPEIVKNLKNPSEWANPYFNVSENEFLKQINNLLAQNQAKFTLSADDLKNVNNTSQTKKWFFDDANGTATLVIGKPKQYLMINNNKVNPIDLNGWNSINSTNGTIDTNNTYVNNLNELNLAVKNGFEIYTNAENLIVSLNKFNETIANDFKTSRMIVNNVNSFASVSKPQVNADNVLSEKADNLLLSVLFTNPKINTNQSLLKNINIDDLPEQIKKFVNELSTNPATDASIVNNAVANYQNYQQDYQHINGGAIAGIVVAGLVFLAIIAGVLWNFFATKKVSAKKEVILSAEDKAALDKIDNEREE